jgi:hypothetical protein
MIIMKISKSKHIRTSGPGAGMPRNNPPVQKFRTEDPFVQMVNSLTYPTIAFKGQEENYPEPLRNELKIIRMLHRMEKPEEFKNQAHDFEAMGYLSTASLSFPPNRDWSEIFSYLTHKYLLWKKIPNPPQPLVEKLSPQQEDMLTKLKTWIRNQQKEALRNKK